MKEVTFTGSLPEVERQAEEWKRSNPHVTIIDAGPPVSAGYWDGHVETDKASWFIIIKYEDQSST